MKKRLIGLGIVTSMMLIGCGSSNNGVLPNNGTYSVSKQPIKSVVQMMPNEEVVGWENYRDDSDGDRVPDYKDKCPNTPAGAPVNEQGCVLDLDKDGVPDYKDKCPNTLIGVKVNRNGCAIDSDGDGVADENDKCPNTPAGIEVDRNGCGLDGDRDGVPDLNDKCPNTPFGAKVGDNGCAIDSDGDGVFDIADRCPNTPSDVKVNFQGCPILAEYRFNFDFNSYQIDSKYYPQIEKLAKVLQENKGILVEVQGFTDNKGSYLYNKQLSLKRANALRELLINKFKISPNRISITGYGSDYPVASNDTEEGQAENRRIIVITKNVSLDGTDMEDEGMAPISVNKESNNMVDEENIDR